MALTQQALKTINRVRRNGRYLIKSFSPSTFDSEEFLFITGLYQEAQRTIKNPFSANYQDWRIGERINDVFDKTFGFLPSDLPHPSEKKPNRRRLIFQSEQVANTLRELTKDNTQPPYELIGEERSKEIAYLRGFCYRGFTVTSVTRMNKSGANVTEIRAWLKSLEQKRELTQKIQLMLDGIGVKARSLQSHLYVGRRGSLKNMLAHKLLSPPQRDKLEQLLSK